MTCGSAAALRVAVCVLSIFVLHSSASAAAWESREGQCDDYQGSWAVDQVQRGVWVGQVDYRHVGGNCGAATGSTSSFKVTALFAGEKGENFFALLTGPQTCFMHGRVEGESVRGSVFCQDAQPANPFSLRFN